MRTYINSLIIYGLLLATAYSAPTDEECDKSKCKGPLQFYQELSCTPVYKNEGDCCAYKYDCDHLKNRSTDKCYINGHEYNLGEDLRDEDKNPCDIGCSCRKGYHDIASFTCAVVDCFGYPKPGCYRKKSPFQCCSGEEVCPEKPEDVPTCKVDGKIYKDAEYFSPADEPNKSCYCMEGYEGKNVEPFCRTIGPLVCGTELRRAYEIHSNCPPVYYSTESPQTDCAVVHRCQNDNDVIIKVENSTNNSEDESASSNEEKSDSDDMTCKFGNLKLKLGEELNQATDYSSVCVKCICEVPPVLTCQRLPDEVCDVTKHPPFNH